jgi:CubicO group peptidase (beta-lactamase class C family)
VRDLLTFTFGFGMDMAMFTGTEPWPVVQATFERGALTIGPPNPAATPDPDRWIAALGSLPLIAQPGERWLYNTGTQVLGVLTARVAGTTYDEVLRTRIFEPLGMTDTGFWADPARLPTAYQPTPDGLVVWDAPDGMWSSPPAFPDGSAGLVSTADDLLAFARMLLHPTTPVLSAEAVAAMTRDQLTPGQKERGGLGPELFADGGWGYGVFVHTAGDRAGAYGWDGGLGTSWLVDPVRDLVVIVLTQRLFDTHLPPPVHTALQAAAYAAVR